VETPTLMSYTPRYINVTEVRKICQVLFRQPIHLCARVSEEWGNGEGVGTQSSPRMSPEHSYTSM
jgi:hypothetical protein